MSILAVLMMVQGGLELLMGVLLTALGPLMMFGFRQAPPGGAGGGPAAGMPLAIVVFYVALGLATLLVGGLRIFTGIRNLKLRSRVLGIVTLSLGFVTVLSCYCAPTSIALFVYGLIVYLNGDVSRAFEMASQGIPPKEVKTRFGV